MREFEIFAFTEQYKGLSLTYDRDGRSITVSFITSTRQQHNRHIVTGEIASEIEGEKKSYWSFTQTRAALRQRLRVVRDFVYRNDRGSHFARRTKTRNFLGISTGIMRPVERIMHPGIRDEKGMITRCCSFLPGVAESLRMGFTRQLVKQLMKFEFLPAALWLLPSSARDANVRINVLSSGSKYRNIVQIM